MEGRVPQSPSEFFFKKVRCSVNECVQWVYRVSRKNYSSPPPHPPQKKKTDSAILSLDAQQTLQWRRTMKCIYMYCDYTDETSIAHTSVRLWCHDIRKFRVPDGSRWRASWCNLVSCRKDFSWVVRLPEDNFWSFIMPSGNFRYHFL